MSHLRRIFSPHHHFHSLPILSIPLHPSSNLYQKRHHVPQPLLKNVDRNRGLAQQCENVTKLGVYSNIGLVFVKGSAGFMTNSMALIADATHSLTDLISDFMTYFTIRYSQRAPTTKFPLGFGKIDSLGTVTVAGLLTLCSYHVVSASVSKLYISASASVITMPHVAMGCVLLSIVVKEWLYRITIKAGDEYHSNVTIANAWHHRSDAYTSAIALVGVGGYWMGYPMLDPICGTIVGVYLLKIGADFFKVGFEQLLDRNSDVHLNDVKGIIAKCDGVEEVHDLMVIQSGQYIHIKAEIVVNQALNMNEAHEIVNNVKTKLYEDEILNIQQLCIVPIPYDEHMLHHHHHEHNHDEDHHHDIHKH